MIRTLFLLVFLLSSSVLFSQRKSDPQPEDIALAKKLQQDLDKEDLVIVSKNTHVTFKYNKRSGLVEASDKESKTFLNVAASSRAQLPLFYDSQSYVETFDIKDHRGKDLYAPVRDEHLKSQEYFHSDYRVKYVNLTFPLQGYKIQVITEKVYKDIKYFTSNYFTEVYRIIDGKLTVDVPNWLELEIKPFNFENAAITQTVEEIEDGKRFVFTTSNLPPQSDESNIQGPSFMYPHVLFIAKSFNDGSHEQRLFSSVDDLFGWYNGLVNLVKIDTSVFAEKVEELTSDATSEEEKVKNIFYWVQDNIRYVAFEDGIAGFQPESPQNVFTKRYGDCKGMAILTKSMLTEAGFDARLVWIGTDRLAYDYSIPSLSVDNHMICSVKLDGEMIFLDGTEKYNRFGDYASRIQNKQALLQDNEGFKILTVPGSKEGQNIDKTSYALRIDGESMLGKVQKQYTGESRVSFQNIYTSFGKSEQDDILPRYVASGNSNYIIKDIEPFDLENRDRDLLINYDVAIEKAVTSFDETLYVDIDPVKKASEMLFEERKSDYKFRMKERQITEIDLEIPEGYTAETPQNLSINNEWVDISLTYEQAGNKILYRKDINLKKRLIKKQSFEAWNADFEQLKNSLNQPVTLTKN